MEQQRKRIALLHHTGCGNLGDDAIIDAVVANIRERWENPEITVFSMNPEDTTDRHDLPSLPIRRYTWSSRPKSATTGIDDPGAQKAGGWFATTRNPLIRLPRALSRELTFLVDSYRMLRSFDLMIVSGGGQLTERGGPSSFPYALAVWSLLAKRAGVKFVFLNVGAGPLKHPLSKFFIVRALYAADYVSFRDQQSQDLATKIGFAGRGCVCPDNVYGYSFTLPNVASSDNSRPVVGLAPMPYPFSDHLKYPTNAEAIQQQLIDKMADFSASIVNQSYSVRLFGSDLKSDPAAIEELRNALLNRHHIPTPAYMPVESVDELLTAMSAMDFVVTCRFHGVVFAHLLNKPILAIAHHPKVTHLMNALGLSQYCFDMDTFDPAQLAAAFKSLVRNSEEIKKNMAASLADYRAKSKVQFDDLFPRASGSREMSDAKSPEAVRSPMAYE